VGFIGKKGVKKFGEEERNALSLHPLSRRFFGWFRRAGGVEWGEEKKSEIFFSERLPGSEKGLPLQPGSVEPGG
jgi:hypothetical protein